MPLRTTFRTNQTRLLSTAEEKWIYVIFFTAFVPFFLITFQPFGVNNYDPTHSVDQVFLFACLGFGLVSGLTLGLYEFFLAPFLFKSDSLTKFILRIVIGIVLTSATLFWFYNYLGNFHDWFFSSFLGFVRDVGALSLVPMCIVFLVLSYRRTLKAYGNLSISPGVSGNPGLIWIEDVGSSNKIAIVPADLLYIQAQDNYVSIHHKENDRVKKTLLRTTMKKLESQLKPLQIVRCHRSYLVNLAAVIKIQRSTNQHLLYLSNTELPIPVSRSYVPLLDGLNAIRHK